MVHGVSPISPLNGLLSLSTSGELQSILCAAYARDDITYTGTLSGDVYQWKGHTLQSVIKGAHNVSDRKFG